MDHLSLHSILSFMDQYWNWSDPSVWFSKVGGEEIKARVLFVCIPYEPEGFRLEYTWFDG